MMPQYLCHLNYYCIACSCISIIPQLIYQNNENDQLLIYPAFILEKVFFLPENITKKMFSLLNVPQFFGPMIVPHDSSPNFVFRH